MDITDFNLLATNFDPSGSSLPNLWNDGNSDGDNDVDITDFNALATNYSPGGYGPAAVPEPASVCLLLVGLLLLTRVRF